MSEAMQAFGAEGWAGLLDLGLLARLGLAALLGGIVGAEREIAGKPAGLRTNLLICVGAALLTELSIGVAALANAENVAQGVVFRADPGRIAAQIVSGIGFLGAGTILQARGSVIGLTTAATIWVVAAIGMAVGAQAYVEAVAATVLVYLSLAVLSRLERVVEKRWGSHRYVIGMAPDMAMIERIEQAFRGRSLRVETSSVEKSGDRIEIVLDVSGAIPDHEQVVRSLILRDDVHRVSRVS